jgi:prolyl-tRNA synthetase
MRQSQLFTKTRKEAPSDETAKNAQLLIRGGFVSKELAGAYAFLPLGLRVLEKIKHIIREEMNVVGGQEVNMTALQEKSLWSKTQRWDDTVVDDWFKTKLKNGTELGLAFTHEEPMANMMKSFISSYKDLPRYVYQFQTKFRNELRSKAGVLRGREFLMKDLYDFSLDKESHEAFYEKMKIAYTNVFNRIGIGEKTYMTISNGGSFSKYSFEFQTLCEAGEDVLVYDEDKKIAINKDDFNDEVFTDFGLTQEDYSFKEAKSIEVGDIYTLGEKYSEAVGLTYTDKDGVMHPVYMGSYGIGVSRLMGAVVEIFSDEHGVIWPESIAPFAVHLIVIGDEGSEAHASAEALYKTLSQKGIEVLYDDRDVRPGQKFADSDLIGIPLRVVISPKTLEAGGLEVKRRAEDDSKVIPETELLALLG